MSRDIAAQAYQDAVRYLEKEFKADSQTLAWLSKAKCTSLDDLRAATQAVETQYRASRSKHGKLNWINGFSSRVMHYGKVLDTLAQHHPEYVGLVWGIIKFVLMGIISHGELVEQFSQALSTISEVLPMTKVSAELYQTEQMKDAIGKLYTHILLFLKQALEWYNVGPASRMLKALFKPFQLGYKDTVDQIRLCAQTIDTISNTSLRSEVREMNVLLQSESRRLQERESKLHGMQLEFRAAQRELARMMGLVLQIAERDTVSLVGIQSDIRDIKPWVQDMHFSHVLGALKPPRTPEEALLKHRSLARRARPWSNRAQSTTELLQKIGNWVTSPNSTLLILQTQARAQARVKQITTELIGHLQPHSKHVFWYLSATSPQDDGSLGATDVIRTLLYQFLKIMPDLLATCPSNFSTVKLESQHSDNEWLDLLFYVVDHLGSCFIVVEAEDVLADPTEGNRLKIMLRHLVGHCNSNRSSVKVLVVSYDRSWEEFSDLDDVGGRIISIRREVVTKRMRRFGSKAMFSAAHWNKSAHRQ